MMVILAGVIITMASFFSSELPDKVPIHFDTNGNPDMFTTRSEAVSTFTALSLTIGWFFVLFGLIIHKIPQKYLNVPNKAWWIREENRPLLQRLILTYGDYLIWMGVALSTFFIALYGYIFETVRKSEQVNSGVIVALSILIVLVVFAFVGVMIKKGMQKPSAPPIPSSNTWQ
jgi:uncharacterized membrane protein